ncbi:hypothetical protein ABT301_29130 [Streptomyces sp. NPDC000987]|uniref:hypothetical protein n=1 Tax=Streptomyces sp. NPDC000987 TaxID=3154374 RepID=UPI0033324EEE
MDAKIALTLLTTRANSEAAAARKAREELIKGCEVAGSSPDSLMTAVLAADATAKPWTELMLRIERHGVRKGLAKQRQEATETLLGYGIALSTSPVTNAARLHEQDGLRRFLSFTQGMDIDDDVPAEETAPQTEEQPAPAPAPVKTPKATPAQKRTLLAIRDNGVTLREHKIGATSVSVERGEKPRKDMVEWVVSQGWAKQDTTRSLFHGQKVTLTETGEAILAG